MSQVKLAIVYYSQTGTNWQMVQWAKDEAEKLGVDVRLRKVKETLDTSDVREGSPWAKYLEESKDVEEATADDLVWADAIILSSPTRFGNVCGQMKNFIDTLGGVWSEGKLVNKLVTGFSSTQNPNGGQEQTIRAMYTSAMHWGAIIVPTGYTDKSIYAQGGNPYGVSVTQGGDGKIANDVEGAIRHQTNRLVDVAKNFIG